MPQTEYRRPGLLQQHPVPRIPGIAPVPEKRKRRMQQCREIKHTLFGDTQTYSCELLQYEPGFGVLRYVVDREYNISGHKLLPGDITYGLYWEDRPYTLYVWDLSRINSKLYYFNIADSISLRSEEFVWRDLTIDVLIDTDNAARILDEQELLPDLAQGLREYIRTAVDLVVEKHQEIIREAEEHIRRVGT
jgi:hypothetical protein